MERVMCYELNLLLSQLIWIIIALYNMVFAENNKDIEMMKGLIIFFYTLPLRNFFLGRE